MTGLLNHLMKRFWQKDSGSVLVFTAFSLMVLVAGVGMSVDFARAYMLKNRLSTALDAAGLAAAAVVNSQDIGTEIDNYFNANFPAGYMGATLTGPHYTIDQDNRVLSLDVTGEIKTSFMHIFGHDTMDVSVESEITRESKGLELVLVMDNTGSMGSYGKLDAMKSAATDLVNILFGNNETVENMWVGLVPYSQSVNIGPQHQDWLDSDLFDALDYGPTSWAGCVDARDHPLDIQDDTPADEPLPPYHWADHNNYNNWIYNDGSYRSNLGVSRGPNKNCSQPVLSMVASKSTILSSINAMQARGNTHSNFGLVWGWRMISPKWRGLWGGNTPADLPLDYHTPLMNKAVILLTDGQNTHSNSVDTAYGYLSDGLLDGATSSSAATAEIDARQAEVCEAMKAQGIIIYTITFRLNNSDTRQLFRNCATDPAYYFNSPSNEELQRAFRAIADSLGNLRISK